MGAFMKFATLILLILVGRRTYAEPNPNLDFRKRLEPLKNAQFVSTPDQDHTELIKAFHTAKKTIYVGIFGISSSKIAKALGAAQKRGVKVIIVCDQYCSNNPKRLEIYNALKNDGVEIYTATTGFTISHWKMFVIDEEKAFVSTMNFRAHRTNAQRGHFHYKSRDRQ